MRKATILLAAMVVAAAFAAPGCGRMAGEAVGTFRGAKGPYTEIRPVAEIQGARVLGIYTRFELGGIEDAFGGKVPPALFEHLPGKFAEQLEGAKLPNLPGGKTLLIRGRIYHYEDEGLLGTVLGPLEEVVARIELVDKDSGQVVGAANCIGRTQEAVNKGPEKKAEGLAKSIVSWIKANYPEPKGDK